MENFELEMLLKVKTEIEKLKKFRQETQDFSKDVRSANNNMAGSFMGVQKGLRDLLSPITMLRRTIFQIGVAWSLTGGTIVASIISISSKIKELDDLSIKYGKSTESLSKEFYGYNIKTKEAVLAGAALKEIQQGVAAVWLKVSSAVTETTGKVIDNTIVMKYYNEELDKWRKQQPKRPWWETTPTPSIGQDLMLRDASRKRADKEEETRIAKVTREDRQNQLTRGSLEKSSQDALLDTYKVKEELRNRDLALYKQAGANEAEINKFRFGQQLVYDRDILDEKNRVTTEVLKLQGNERDAFVNNQVIQTEIYFRNWGPDQGLMQLRKKFTDLEIEQFDRARLGLITNQQAMEGFTKQSVSAMKSSFTSFFQDAFSGQLKTAREYFMAFLQDITNAWSRAMAEMVANQILMPGQQKPSKTAQALGIVSSIASIAGGVPGPAVTPGTTNIPRIEGAFAATPRAEGGWLGLNGPEIGLVGEREPEMVTPLSKMGNVGGTQTKNVYYFIQAVDPRSFAEIVSNNPDAIVAVTERAIESNKKIRRTIRNLT